MQNDALESLLIKAKELEKKYEWLQAAKYYTKASDLVLQKDISKSADFQERMGFCYFKAAFQSRSNKQFIIRISNSIEFYNKTLNLFSKIDNAEIKVRIADLRAKIEYANSWLESKPLQKKEFLDRWWKLKTSVLAYYKKSGNSIATAKTCNDMIEGSFNCRYWLGMNRKESQKIRKELISLGKLAIQSISKNQNQIYELARAYCWTSCYYLLSNTLYQLGVINEESHEGLNYSQKALELAQKTGDAWLIGWSCFPASIACDKNNEYQCSIAYASRSIEQGKITKDNFLSGLGRFWLINEEVLTAEANEDPNKVRELLKSFLKTAETIVRQFQIINLRTWNRFFPLVQLIGELSLFELNIDIKHSLLERGVECGRKAINLIEGWRHSAIPVILSYVSNNIIRLSEIETDLVKKRRLLKELLKNTQRSNKIQQYYPHIIHHRINNQDKIALGNFELSKLERKKNKKISILKDAIAAIEVGIQLVDQISRGSNIQEWLKNRYGKNISRWAGIYYSSYIFTSDKNLLIKAIEINEKAVILFRQIEHQSQEAEARWQTAKFQDKLGDYLEASNNYGLASQAYNEAAIKIPQLEEFFKDYSLYMRAWSQIEQARHAHSIEDYQEAKQHYEKAAKLHESTSLWNYLGPNYLAWANLEEAESLSRKENLLQSKQIFQKALKQFSLAEESMKQKLEELSLEEKKMTQRLLEVSDLRHKYCQARILMEEAKLLEKEAKYRQSSRNYEKAAQIISTIVEKIDVEAEQKELEYIAILCHAWEKMAAAEETSSSELYLEAAELFQQAKSRCYTSKATFWALGNSNFCKGLAAGARYQANLELSEHSKAKSFMKSASIHYANAGFKSASEYAKATQRLFDAYLFMNEAESEANQEKRAKQYQMAENLLRIAARSFMKAKQLEKTARVKNILANVKEEKALAVSLSQVMQAPNIASSTMSFSAPSPTNEASVGLESFEHANVQANVVTHVKEVKIGESVSLSVEFVNAGREPALLMQVEDFIPSDFIVVKKPEIYRIEETTLNMKGKQIAPLKLVETKVVLQATKQGIYKIKPKVNYLDERGQKKSLQIKPVEIKVEEVFLQNRVSTGTKELDSVLLGGIPKDYAVVLSGSPSDERELLVSNFLIKGLDSNQTTFFVASEAANLENLLENQKFHLFLCNPKPKFPVPDLPQITKLRSKSDINNLSMALARETRILPKESEKRVCIEVVSDILLDYGAKTARKWISELITDLGSKGFTILAVLDSSIHPVDQANAVLNLFDGEIVLTQSDDPLDCKKSVQVKKLRGQDYIKNPICLTKP